MWGRSRKHGTRLSRQLALADLQDAMAQAEQEGEDTGDLDPVPYPPASAPVPDIPAARPGLRAADVPVDNSSGPGPEEGSGPSQRELPAQRTRHGTRHGSFG
jgi:hypothetical protein